MNRPDPTPSKLQGDDDADAEATDGVTAQHNLYPAQRRGRFLPAILLGV